MSAAARTPTFDPAGAPLSVLVDFDGTISLEDVGDALLGRLVDDRTAIAQLDRRYDTGEVGSRELLAWDMEVLPHDAEVLRREVGSIDLDGSFVELVRQVREMGAAIEIVSDGIGFHIEEMLLRLDLADVPVATNAVTLGRGADGVSFPYGNVACFVCGTCKRERVRLHQAAGRAVVFVGDGTSDRYAAHHADIVFAKAALADWCRSQGIAFEAWDRLGEIAAWISATFSDGRLPGRTADHPAWAAGRPVRTPEFICGPEVWGEGRTTPHPGTFPRDARHT
jgi:2-hydroxy-3-keto-5-methylthiopentenyl-1-phosphate phosphatase